METPLWDPISEPAKDLIQRMLTTDVNHRITIQEVLNHKWLRVSKAIGVRISAIPLFAGYDKAQRRNIALVCMRVRVNVWDLYNSRSSAGV